MNILEAKNIYKRFSNHVALDDVSISIPEGSIYGLLGPNGAGKTTFLRIINQITGPDEGTISFDGKPLLSDDIYKIGYLPEERGLYKKMKVGEQALYLAQLKGLSKSEALKKLRFWFEKFEIQPWWDKKVEELSKGMQQKIQFVTTILHNPKLLIFDEPFSGFDPINSALLKNEILELKKNGATIIFSTHNMESVEELCDHITLINKSRAILQGNVSQIRQDFKTNVFVLKCTGLTVDPNSFGNSKFIVKNQFKEDVVDVFELHVDKDIDENALLKLWMDHSVIKSFHELIPSMNEIFINVVNDHKAN